MIAIITNYYYDIKQFDKITSKFLTILFDFILVNITFSNAFMVLNLPHIFLSFISLLRDLSILIILFFLGLKNLKIPEKNALIYQYLIILFFIPLFIFFANVFDGNNQTRIVLVLRGIWWTIRPFCILLVLINYKQFYTHKMNMGHYLIKSSIIMFFISLIFYKFLPGMITHMRFENRISLGNPSMQSSIFVGALIVLLDTLPFKKSINFFCLIVLSVAIICTISLTGISCLFAILFSFCFQKKSRNYIIPLLLIVGIILFFFLLFNTSLSFYVDFFKERMEELGKVLTKYLFNHGADVGSNSFRAREGQIQGVIDNLETSSYLFGCGEINCTGGRFGIENFYFALLTNYGLAGVFAFFVLQFIIVKDALINKKRKQLSLLIFLLYLNFYSISLDLINTYSLSSIFIFVGYILYQERKLK